jgi:hypothetical protein
MKTLIALAVAGSLGSFASNVAGADPLPVPVACGTNAIGTCSWDPTAPLSSMTVNTQSGVVTAVDQAQTTYTATSGATWGGFTLTLYAADGTSRTVTAAFQNTRSCVHSGRGQTCTTHHVLVSGSVTP